ncbi:hypothetical protein GCM10027074_10920 [Streptomyces deserti]
MWSTFSAGVSGRMGDTVLPVSDKSEISAGQVPIRLPSSYTATRRSLTPPPRPCSYTATPSICSVCTDFAANGTLTDLPLRRMSERAV